jgi:hypothetical protein
MHAVPAATASRVGSVGTPSGLPCGTVDERTRGGPWLWLRVALAAFVLLWILGPSELRDRVPILLVFAIALGLELHFLVSALRGAPARRPDRLPQEIDRERYGFDPEPENDLEGDGLGLGAPDGVFEKSALGEEDEEDVGVGGEPQGRSVAGPLRRFGLGLGVIAALGGLAWYADSRSGWSSLPGDTRAAAVARFSNEASEIAGKPVTIRCDAARDYVGAVQHADGVAVVGGDLAILTPEVCDDLYRLAFHGETTGSRTGRALAVLAHESWHLRGVEDEGMTECYALQSGVGLGERFGLSEGAARQLMRTQLIENQLRGADTLEYRIPPDCRNGGRLDLDSASSRFP